MVAHREAFYSPALTSSPWQLDKKGFCLSNQLLQHPTFRTLHFILLSPRKSTRCWGTAYLGNSWSGMVFSFPPVYRVHALTATVCQLLWCSRLITKIHSWCIDMYRGRGNCDLCYLTPDEVRTGVWHLGQITPELREMWITEDVVCRSLQVNLPKFKLTSSFRVKDVHTWLILWRMVCSWKGS